jgi:hypothetical protein
LASRLFDRLRDIALFAALICAGATVGASAPLLAGQNDGTEDGSSEIAPAIAKNAVGSGSRKARASKKNAARPQRSKKAAKEKKPSRSSAAPSPGSPDAIGSFEGQPLAGRTIDFEYDGHDAHSVSLAYSGRVFVPDRVIAEGKPVPVVVFFHGLNKALVRHRWMGGGQEGDVRRIVLDLIAEGAIPPVIVAGPGSIQPDAVSDGASFPVFDFDKFMNMTKKSLEGIAEIDPRRIVVTGHSGAGCSEVGGIVSSLHSAFTPLSIISIDTCMGSKLALSLSAAPPDTNVVVTWQTGSWDRDFDSFQIAFKKSLSSHPAAPGVLRTLDELPTKSHDATVAMTLKKYLPEVLR